MTTQTDFEQLRTRARERLLVAIGVALLMAGLALVVAVLPAEFGIDPTGVGRRLGLLALSDLKGQVAQFERTKGAATTADIVVPDDRRLQQEKTQFELAPHEFVEYKYRLEKGQTLLYSWQATAAVNVEFHAEPDGAPRGYAESYEKRNGVQSASGTLHAPFAGIHGWYWENTTDAPVTVALSSAGFYAGARVPQRGRANHQDVPVVQVLRPPTGSGQEGT